MAQLRGREHVRYVSSMFARISRRYDFMNTVMSAGRHHSWRRMATGMVIGKLSGPALDVATGTGDFAIELARMPLISHVVGLDYTREMLSIGLNKAKKKGLSNRIGVVVGDAHNLPFPDDSFICVTVGFGARNFIDLPQALRELLRVVKPGGKIAILEIVRIENSGLKGKLLSLYFRYVTPWLGALLTGNREAYTYLPESVQRFLDASELSSLLEVTGLRNVTCYTLALGTTTIHIGEKV